MRRAPEIRLVPGSGVAGFFEADRAFLLRALLQVDAGEVDRLQHQRREAAVANLIGQHAAGEGEQDARRFAEQERIERFLRDVAEREQARIGEVDDERDLLTGLGADFDLQRDFVHVVAHLVRADVELHVDRGRVLLLIDGRRVRILEREVLHVLRQHTRLGRIIGAIASGIAEFGEGVVLGHPTFLFRSGDFRAPGALRPKRLAGVCRWRNRMPYCSV